MAFRTTTNNNEEEEEMEEENGENIEIIIDDLEKLESQVVRKLRFQLGFYTPYKPSSPKGHHRRENKM